MRAVVREGRVVVWSGACAPPGSGGSGGGSGGGGAGGEGRVALESCGCGSRVLFRRYDRCPPGTVGGDCVGAAPPLWSVDRTSVCKVEGANEFRVVGPGGVVFRAGACWRASEATAPLQDIPAGHGVVLPPPGWAAPDPVLVGTCREACADPRCCVTHYRAERCPCSPPVGEIPGVLVPAADVVRASALTGGCVSVPVMVPAPPLPPVRVCYSVGLSSPGVVVDPLGPPPAEVVVTLPDVPPGADPEAYGLFSGCCGCCAQADPGLNCERPRLVRALSAPPRPRELAPCDDYAYFPRVRCAAAEGDCCCDPTDRVEWFVDERLEYFEGASTLVVTAAGEGVAALNGTALVRVRFVLDGLLVTDVERAVAVRCAARPRVSYGYDVWPLVWPAVPGGSVAVACDESSSQIAYDGVWPDCPACVFRGYSRSRWRRSQGARAPCAQGCRDARGRLNVERPPRPGEPGGPRPDLPGTLADVIWEG